MPVLTIPKILGLVVMLIGLLMFLGGCANQAAQLQPQIVAADGAAKSGTILLNGNQISKSSAGKLSTDLHVLDVGFKSALASIQANQPPAATVTAQILASLSQIALDLQATPTLKAKGDALQRKMASLSPGARKMVTPGEVISLIDLVVTLTPEVITEINTLFGGSTITAADCQTALATFETSLAALDAAIAAH